MQDLLARALSRDRAAECELVDLLTPVIQKRVARTLLRLRPGASSGRIRQEVEDLTQEVYKTLFNKNGRVLRTWDPERGLSLLNFVGMVAEKRAAGILRPKNGPLRNDEQAIEPDVDPPHPGPSPVRVIISREILHRLKDRVEEELTPEGRQMFRLLFRQELSPAEVARKTGKSLDAVYKWQSRLRQLVLRLRDELSNPDGDPQKP